MNKITDTHKDYDKYIKRWQLCRDAFEGTDAIKGKKEVYLPRPYGMQDDEYKAYIGRALWFAATTRTVDGMRGLIDPEEAVVEAPGSESIMDDATTEGMPFRSFIDQICQEVLVVGRYGVLIEHPEALPEGKTRLDAEEQGVRPYALGIRAEDITNWTYSRIGNLWKLSRVVFRTCGTDSVGKEDVEYIECYVDAAGGYVQAKWRKTTGTKDDYSVYKTDYPMMDGKRIPDIPFWFVSTQYGSKNIKKSPISDLADVNVSHYCTQADLEHGRFFLGFPTPVLAGFNLKEGTVVSIGSTTVLQAPDGNAKWGYMEFTGQGLSELKDGCAQKEDMMSKLGARMLLSDNAVPETATAVLMKASGQSCVLAAIANSIAQTSTEFLEFMLKWAGAGAAKVEVKLNTDYAPSKMTAQELTAWTDALIKGGLRKVDYFKGLQAGGVIEEDVKFEDYDAETDELTQNLPEDTDSDAEIDPLTGKPKVQPPQGY